jgi:outer membrane protein assembly factor BamB
MALRRVTFGIALLVLLGGCGGRGKDTIEPPAELTAFEASLDVQRLWSGKVGGASERLRLGLRPATDGARIYAGAYDGQVASFDAETGNKIWAYL